MRMYFTSSGFLPTSCRPFLVKQPILNSVSTFSCNLDVMLCATQTFAVFGLNFSWPGADHYLPIFISWSSQKRQMRRLIKHHNLLCISLYFCFVFIFKAIRFTTLVSGILRYPYRRLLNSRVKVHSCQASATTKAGIVVWELYSWGSHAINITGPIG